MTKKRKVSQFTATELEKYLKEKGNHHKYYNQYVGKQRLLANLKNKCMYLTDGSEWNDKEDKRNLKRNSGNKKRYCSCFSYSTVENVAMWLIYAHRNNADGILMRISNKIMKSIIDSIVQVEIGNFVDGSFVGEEIITVQKENCYLVDMYYLSRNAKDKRISRQEEHFDISQKVYQKTKQYSKHYAWHHENESRLIIEIDENNCKNCNVVRINLPNIIVDQIIQQGLIEGPLNKKTVYKKSILKGKLFV